MSKELWQVLRCADPERSCCQPKDEKSLRGRSQLLSRALDIAAEETEHQMSGITIKDRVLARRNRWLSLANEELVKKQEGEKTN